MLVFSPAQLPPPVRRSCHDDPPPPTPACHRSSTHTSTGQTYLAAFFVPRHGDDQVVVDCKLSSPCSASVPINHQFQQFTECVHVQSVYTLGRRSGNPFNFSPQCVLHIFRQSKRQVGHISARVLGFWDGAESKQVCNVEKILEKRARENAGAHANIARNGDICGILVDLTICTPFPCISHLV